MGGKISEGESTASRKIIHIDMDCFYAAVEIRDKPELQGKPVAVGGSSKRRGVLTTCSYEARRFGCHSAMSSYEALKRCPDLILLPVRMSAYKAVSTQIHQVLAHYSDNIEPLSLDEAYLDVSHSDLHQGSASLIARDLRQAIFDATGLSASAGIAGNKFLAKIASDWNKPNGQFCIEPAKVDAFMPSLSLGKIPGVGRVTLAKLEASGFYTCADIQKLSEQELGLKFGRFGARLYQLSRGIDHRPVQNSRVRKSLGAEHTYASDLSHAQCQDKLSSLYDELERRLNKHNKAIDSLVIKVKFSDFSQITRQSQAQAPSLLAYSQLLKTALNTSNKTVRLLGVAVQFAQHDTKQLNLSLTGDHHGSTDSDRT